MTTHSRRSMAHRDYILALLEPAGLNRAEYDEKHECVKMGVKAIPGKGFVGVSISVLREDLHDAKVLKAAKEATARCREILAADPKCRVEPLPGNVLQGPGAFAVYVKD